MTDMNSQNRKPTRLRRLLLLLAAVAILWGAAALVRWLLPPAPLELARAAIAAGQFDQAIEQYERHLAKKPNDWGIRCELGLVLSEIDRPRAMAEFRMVPEDSEAYPEAKRQLIGICLATERLEEAEAALRDLTERIPDDAWPPWTLAELYFRQGRPREALPYAEQAAELDSQNTRIQFLTAEILDDLRRPGEMIAPLQKVLELELDNYAAHLNLSYAYSEAGQPERSREEAEWCLARNPNDVNAHRFLAEALRDQGDVDQGMQTIERALTLSPYDLECRLLQAELLIFTRREQEALKHLEPLYENYPNDRRLVALLARAAAASGQAEDAARYRAQAQKLMDE